MKKQKKSKDLKVSIPVLSPRIQGAVINADGKFQCVVVLGCRNNTTPDETFYSIKTFKTEKAAKVYLKKQIKGIHQHFQMQLHGKVTGDYLDLNQNEVRSWDDN